MTEARVSPLPIVSVVVCTRNPRSRVLCRTIEHLVNQNVSADDWEAIVVDNASDPPVASILEPWRDRIRVVVHPELGLTSARLRGVREAVGELLVFVDDDNLLDPDYLATAIELARRYPAVGVFGGRISPEFEETPPEWLEPFYSHLAIASFATDEWSNLNDDRAVIPCGAGLCIRRPLAVVYADCAASDARRLRLDRVASSTMSCGDTDMVLTCLDEGWGSARFTALHLTHVIPARRIEFGYHKRLAYDIGFSYGQLLAIRGCASRGRRLIALGKAGLALLGVKHRGKARAIDLAYHRGFYRGLMTHR